MMMFLPGFTSTKQWNLKCLFFRVSEAPCIFCPGTDTNRRSTFADWSMFPDRCHMHHPSLATSINHHNLYLLTSAMMLSTFSIVTKTKAVACLLMLALAVTTTQVVNGKKILLSMIVEWLYSSVLWLHVVYCLLFCFEIVRAHVTLYNIIISTRFSSRLSSHV